MKKNKMTHSIEDYLEMIYLFSEEIRSVRITDLATRMNVRKSSIVSAVKKLAEGGFVEHERYGAITITESGRIRAQEVYNKHRLLKDFFLNILGLPENIAENDACNIEHYISEQTVIAIKELSAKLSEEEKKIDF